MTVLSMVPTDTPFLPAHVSEVPREVLRNYPHSKKVGQYLLGTTLGEGSFAKVKEALHIPTGEKVRTYGLFLLFLPFSSKLIDLVSSIYQNTSCV